MNVKFYKGPLHGTNRDIVPPLPNSIASGKTKYVLRTSLNKTTGYVATDATMSRLPNGVKIKNKKYGSGSSIRRNKLRRVA